MEKAELRDAMSGIGPVSPESNLKVVAALFGFLSSRLPGTIAAYLGMPSEVDLSPLADRLPGWRWVLPRVETDRLLTFRHYETPRERHEFGMEQPQAVGPVVPVAEIDLFLVPGVAFDPSGGRLGRGGGFYDRVLAGRRSDAVAIGVTTESRIVSEVPVADHDVRVGWLASE